MDKMLRVLIHVIVSLLVIAMATLPIMYFADMEYKYDVDKCQNMKRSNYEFTHDIQINAQYSKICYHTLNHPLAKYENHFIGFLLLFMFIVIVNIVVIACWMSPFNNLNKSDETSYY